MRTVNRNRDQHRFRICLLPAFVLVLFLCACSARQEEETRSAAELSSQEETAQLDTSRFLIAVEDEPDTVDFQCTTIHYTIAQNVFNRLVEMEYNVRGDVVVMPSLAKSWDISKDRCCYTFHLQENVTFSNGRPLTSSDVGYTLTRLLTHPDSCNRDIAESILGADALESGETDRLEGFEAIDDLTFSITLKEPFEAFLPCLSMPGASIMDEETLEEVGARFGREADATIGTGSFILREWNPGKGLLLTANPDCWAGPPACDGLDLRFVTEAETVRMMYESGELDVMDLDELGSAAEYYVHGDIYQDLLYKVQQIGTTYIALNESVEPLQDVRVRRALQLALNRTALLDAIDSGRGLLENGIFPHGLIGYNRDLPELSYDQEGAKELLAQAGYRDGFDLTLTVRASSASWYRTLATMAAHMWEKIGVRVHIQTLDEDEFMRRRKAGEIACYAATWIADYDDPDNFIYTFFGSRENTTDRSLCYPDEEIMGRVRAARGIADSKARLKEYQELEQLIVQEDVAWIPLFSRLRYYVVSKRLDGFWASWNGSVKNNYRHMSIREN